MRKTNDGIASQEVIRDFLNVNEPHYKIDWIQIITIAVMVTCVVVSIQVYYNQTEKECINNPLVYGAKEMEDIYGYRFQGSGYFIMNHTSPIIVYFDSTNVSVENVVGR